MISFPTSKINLGLYITAKRIDGYHDLETVMIELPFTDVLEVEKASENQFKTSGLPIMGTGNLCTDALNLLRKEKDFPAVYMHLQKHIPMGGGMGGGSSNGAFVLKGINQQFDLGYSENELENFAAKLGSDSPFFIRGGAQFCTGRGEILTPIPFPLMEVFILLVNPQIHVSTKEAFSKVVPRKANVSLMEVIKGAPSTWKDFVTNQFEESVFPLYPEIQKVKNDLYAAGAEYASLSGSGATVYGIFKQKTEIIFPENYLLKEIQL